MGKWELVKRELIKWELVKWYQIFKIYVVSDIILASFPGSCVGGEKRAWYTLFAHAQFSQDFWEFGNSRKICSITLTSARHADFSHTKDACH